MSVITRCTFLKCKQPFLGPASILQGQVVKGVRLAEACGMTTNTSHDDTLQYSGTNISKKREYLAEILKWRASNTPDHVLYNICNNKVFNELVFIFN